MKEYKKPTMEIIKLHIEENIASTTNYNESTDTFFTVFDLFQTTSGAGGV